MNLHTLNNSTLLSDEGTFAKVYKTLGQDGKELAVKVYRPEIVSSFDHYSTIKTGHTLREQYPEISDDQMITPLFSEFRPGHSISATYNFKNGQPLDEFVKEGPMPGTQQYLCCR